MNQAKETKCCLCGAACEEEIPIRGVGQICAGCLMAGRFFGSSSPLRASVVAECLGEMSKYARGLLNDAVREAEALAERKKFDAARESYLLASHIFLDAGRPLMAVNVLYRALRLPGQSAEVYEVLGMAMQAMGCKKEAVQHLKTGSWLAIQSNSRKVSERTLKVLAELVPEDRWLEKARERMSEWEASPEERCSFCGRIAADAGPLLKGSEAAVCSRCIRRLMSLDGETH